MDNTSQFDDGYILYDSKSNNAITEVVSAKNFDLKLPRTKTLGLTSIG